MAGHQGLNAWGKLPKREKNSSAVSIRPIPFVVHSTDTFEEESMRYLLMICGDESAPPTAEQADAMHNEYMDFAKAMSDRGVLQGGERLHPTSDATTVRVRDGEVITSDGPFAETKEQIGGYFLVDCNNID